MSIFRPNILFFLIILIFHDSSAALDNKDQKVFSNLQRQLMTKSGFKVLADSPFVIGSTQRTPFLKTVNDKAALLIKNGLSQQQAFELSEKEFFEKLASANMSLSSLKSESRSHFDGLIAQDFCHSQTGECISQQNPKTMGKRPSRGQLPYFFPDQYYLSLEQLKTSASLKGDNQPWSDDYWAIRDGITARRYADRKATKGTWSQSLTYVLQEPNHLLSLLQLTDGPEKQKRLNQLSPAEKYDLLIGDIDPTHYSHWFEYLENPGYSQAMNICQLVGGALSANQWRQGQVYFDDKGEVESWMGICHGWSAASTHLPRPFKPVKALAFDGKTSLLFYPADIKALGSLLWAESAPRSRFIGGRCNSKDVETDPETGAILDENCFDTNPGDWHVVVSNYLGEMKQSFVMDATFDYAVWNQPVLAYDLQFFNPNSYERSIDFKEVMEPWEDYELDDPFQSVREKDSRRKYIVGVNMKVEYLAENRPTQKSRDSHKNDQTLKAYYIYDLELDKDFNIIGGEWMQNKHPDFLWAHDKDQKAISPIELYYASSIDALLMDSYHNGQISFKKPLQQDLSQYAKASAKRGQVSAFIVEALFREAQL